MLAKTDERTAIRCFFPRLYSAQRTDVHLSQDELTQWYEHGIRPALSQMFPESIGDWAPTYKAELFRTSKQKGGFALGTKPIPDWSALIFGQALRNHLRINQIHWADDFLFQIQVKGMKTATFHACNQDAAQQAWDHFVRDYDIAIDGQWFADIGLEFSIPGHALLWRTDSHYFVIEYLFPHNSHEFYAKLSNLNSRYYKRDLSSHIADLSGCRCHVFSYSLIHLLTTYLYLLPSELNSLVMPIIFPPTRIKSAIFNYTRRTKTSHITSPVVIIQSSLMPTRRY